jgi:hypothetical protein
MLLRWYSHYISVAKELEPELAMDNQEHPTTALARMKLKDFQFHEDENARLAALGCRVLLPFDHFSSNSHNRQATLVESYMRVVFYIPPSREYVWSGYPSEPILSQAAGQLLNSQKKKFIELAPEIVFEAFRNHLLDRGERGELIAQVLLTIAHDQVIINNNPSSFALSLPFHSPIKLLDLLEQLFSPEVWQHVCNAMALEAYEGDAKLEDRFDKAWVSFSHFGELGDQESLKLKVFLAASVRGMGIKPSRGQPFLDIALPAVFADSKSAATAHIIEGRVSIIQFQVKNRDKPDYVSMDSPLAKEVPGNLPVLSIIMEFGMEKSSDKSLVKVQTTAKGAYPTRQFQQSSATALERRHYVITVYGCTWKTYRCMPQHSEIYCTLLAAQKPFHGLERSQNHEMLYELKPKFFMSKTLNNLSWYDE